jgi:basic amino acid/polyamine antiporter, APA family
MSTSADAERVDRREAVSGEDLPVFSRNATGLVRQVSSLDMFIFNAASTSPLGTGVALGLSTLVLFPRANLFIAFPIALFAGVFVWTTFALMSAAIPRVGGDYTFNSRILHPWIAMGATLCALISACIASGLFGYFVSVGALSPGFSVLGAVADSKTLTDWGAYFSGANPTVCFVTALVSLSIVAGLALRGTRVVARAMTTLMLIALVGFVITMLILLFKSPDGFRETIDRIGGQGTYSDTVAAGAGKGLYPSEAGHSTRSTIGAVYFALTLTVFVWWGTYLSSEFKGAGRRARQLKVMAGAGLGQGLLSLLCIGIFLHTVGRDFYASALSGNLSAPGSDTIGSLGYGYFASIVSGSTILAGLLAVMFLGWWLPQTYINSAMVQRVLFTWSFDGLLPRVLGKVDQRFHVPVVAIGVTFVGSVAGAAWASYSSNFFQVFSAAAFFAFFPIIFVGLSAVVMRRRRPDLYFGTPAEWRIAGIEVLPVAGAGCFLTGLSAIPLALVFHEALGIKSGFWAVAAPALIFVIAAIWWTVARGYRSGQGVDLAAAYKQIPPD